MIRPGLENVGILLAYTALGWVGAQPGRRDAYSSVSRETFFGALTKQRLGWAGKYCRARRQAMATTPSLSFDHPLLDF